MSTGHGAAASLFGVRVDRRGRLEPYRWRTGPFSRGRDARDRAPKHADLAIPHLGRNERRGDHRVSPASRRARRSSASKSGKTVSP